MRLKLKPLVLCLGLLPAIAPAIALASSHREAPFVAGMPQVDASDFYMFTSYEKDRADYVTMLANYDPLQDAYSGPNFHFLNPRAVYDFHIDNNGDGKADLTYRFRFTNTNKDLQVPSGNDGKTSVPLINIGGVSASNQDALNRIETYTVQVIDGDGSSFTSPRYMVNASSGSNKFTKPVDNIGNKSIADYEAYADSYIYNVNIPGCDTPGRVFVGQRKDGFVANLGEIFDLVNLNPLGARDSTPNTLTTKNVTTLALEVPKSCLLEQTADADPVIGGWTTASVPKIQVVSPPEGTEPQVPASQLTQVSRLGSPLVNELVIGLKDKDKFNGSQPSDDGQFLHYVTNPSVPVLLNVLFGVKVPGTPRNDLVAAFLTGIKGINQPKNVVPSEMLRLNTSIAPTLPSKQSDLGVLGGDLAGFPNGRRPYDDVVDIALRAEEGAVCGIAGTCGGSSTDPNGGAPFTDGARSPGPTINFVARNGTSGKENAGDTYMAFFPYLLAPVPGSPNGPAGANGNGEPADAP